MFISRFEFWKAFACALNKPFIAINHLEGHALSPKLKFRIKLSILTFINFWWSLTIFKCSRSWKYKRLGTTIDDALGEAFDKTAKLLGIEFPGGPQIEVLAKKGDPNKYDLPRPIFK